MSPADDGLSPIARGYLWANRITGIGLEMILPIAAGYFLDEWLGTRPWFMLGLMPIGFILGMFHLIKLAKADDTSSVTRHDRGENRQSGPNSDGQASP